ncbi:c-type cytochrome [Verrucomicrobiales bacterium BCK34]|nr:c-type cytochrome [Verrucomicrobiales bacterium BCK34]
MKILSRSVLFLLVAVACSCGDPQAEISLEEAEAIVLSNDIYGQICATCHGVSGEGKEELFSPSIAGLPAWYVKDQLKQFRDSHRGIDPGDIPGQQMRAISLSLTDDQIEEAAALVAAMPSIPTEAPGPEADIEAGRYFFANQCMECHRYNGKGEAVFHSAPLITLNRSYLKRQLENYRSGIRGAVGDDVYGNKMVEMTKRLTDEEIQLAVDYIGALAHGDDPRSARER